MSKDLEKCILPLAVTIGVTIIGYYGSKEILDAGLIGTAIVCLAGLFVAIDWKGTKRIVKLAHKITHRAMCRLDKAAAIDARIEEHKQSIVDMQKHLAEMKAITAGFERAYLVLHEDDLLYKSRKSMFEKCNAATTRYEKGVAKEVERHARLIRLAKQNKEQLQYAEEVKRANKVFRAANVSGMDSFDEDVTAEIQRELDASLAEMQAMIDCEEILEKESSK